MPAAQRPTPALVPSSGRRGIAMPLVLTAVVALTLLSAGAFVASRQTFRAGRNSLVEQRAMVVSEYGLNQRIAIWEPRYNLPAVMGGVAVGEVDTLSPPYVSVGDTARVRVTRLTPLLYSVESVGRASIPRPQLQSVRSVSALVRLAYPQVNVRGALTAAADVNIRGNATVSGKDTVPATWSQTQCASFTRADTMPSVAVPLNSRITTQGSPNITGPFLKDAAAADSNTYVRFGTVTWNELAANATIKIPGGTWSPSPSATATNDCAFGDANWGEPNRGAGSVTPCANYFPIVYSSGTLTLNGSGRGQGILLVNGDIKLAGTFKWVGLIIARDDVDGSHGTADVFGSMMAANLRVDGNREDGAQLAGTQRIQFSRCAIETVLRGSAALVRVRDRGWTQVF